MSKRWTPALDTVNRLTKKLASFYSGEIKPDPWHTLESITDAINAELNEAWDQRRLELADLRNPGINNTARVERNILAQQRSERRNRGQFKKGSNSHE